MEKKLSGDARDRTGAFRMQSESCTTELHRHLGRNGFKTHLFTVAHYFVVMIRAE